jgi:hypothetical protein
MKFISKHRVSDGHPDCFYEEDEDLNGTVMSTLNLTYHFKCKTTDEWWPRPMISNGLCSDYSDTVFIGNCKTASDIGCSFLRGLHSPPVDYVFQENCNGILRLTFSSNETETDETNCDEWPWPIYRECDGYWDTSNGEDELNCPNTTLSYITHKSSKCSVNEHYCVYENGTMGCLSKERAGDGKIDCMGATDERTTLCAPLYPRHPFRCVNSDCIQLSALCDNNPDCLEEDDELICPWRKACGDPDFSCQNGNNCIQRTRQCDGIVDCQPKGEDEWFCDLGYRRITQFSLDKIEEYPLFIDSPHLMTTITALHPVSFLPANVLIKSESINPQEPWFCNDGIIITTRSCSIKCLCPPSYYGPICQYQAERLSITVRIDTLATLSGHENQENAIRLVACLMLDDAVVHHEQILHEPLMKQTIYLNYPRPPPKQRGNWSVRLDAFVVTMVNVDFKASWLFDVPFSFLPVNRLVLHLTLKDQETCGTRTCVHGSCKKYLNSPHRAYCQCEQNWSGRYCNLTNICLCAKGGQCADRYPTPICVCPLGRMGSECQAWFDPCSDIKCQHGGTCLPLDERQSTKLFTCSCQSGYYGSRCEHANAIVDIQFSESLFSGNAPTSAAIFVHFLELQKDSPGILLVQNRVLLKNVRLNKPHRIFSNNKTYLSPFILLQVFFKPDNFGYYIGAITKNQITNITTMIYKSNRCPHINELLLNETIRGYPPMKKVKYYSRACKVSKNINWFHDEAYLCFCYKDRLPDCLFFQQEPTQCTTDYCKNNGRCVQNNFNGVWDFGCVCSGCAYGSLCQLTTSQYALSLDTMLGQDILENVPLSGQPLLVKLVLTVLVLMLSLGFVSNILSLMTFKQPKVREFGCGVYLFCLPIIGQFGLTVFAGRFFYLLGTQLYNVNNRSAVLWSCISLEYFLCVCPMLFDWLTACVAVERSVNIIKGPLFKKANSVWWAKRIIVLLTIVVLVSAWHEPLIRQLIDDPRATNMHTWCVVTFPWPWLEYYRLTVNLINLIAPGSINLVTTVFLLHKSTRMKQKFVKKQSEKGYFKSFKKQLPLYGSPLALVVLSLMRLVFSFTLVCITRQWQKYVYLTAYFISFAPLMGTFPIFVLPAKVYKTEFNNFVIKASRKLRLIWAR